MHRKKVTISRAVVPSSKVIISFYESDWNLGPEPRVKVMTSSDLGTNLVLRDEIDIQNSLSMNLFVYRIDALPDDKILDKEPTQ